MKTAFVNGQEISGSAVGFELDRLVQFYRSHGLTEDEVKKSLPLLEEKALEQAIGAKLLLDRAAQLDLPVSSGDIDAEEQKVIAQVGGEENYRKALAAQHVTADAFRKTLEKGVRVNMLVNQACAHVPDPTEAEVTAFYDAHKADYGAQPLVEVHGQIKDLLRHEARGRAMDAFVAELRAAATVEYKQAAARPSAH